MDPHLIIPILRRQRPKDYWELETSLGYIASSYPKRIRKKEERRVGGREGEKGKEVPGMMAHAFNPAARRQRQVENCLRAAWYR